MGDVEKALGFAVRDLSDQNYAQSLSFCRFWLGIGQTYHQTSPDQMFDAIWNNRVGSSFSPSGGRSELIHPAARLILRLASDVESDHTIAPQTPGLQGRLCTRSLGEFFAKNLETVWYKMSRYGNEGPDGFFADANLIAHWINLGYVEEATIRDHILQSLISHPSLYDHQAHALIILFKLAGPTFEAYAGPSVVDRCFELLKNQYPRDDSARIKQVQEVINLRERGWEGLPPPPVFTAGRPKPTGANQRDPATTPVATSLGLPNRDLEPQIPQSPPFEPVAVPEADTIPASPITPAVHSPSISIATLSDFTIADASDDESPVDSSITDTSDDELPTDPTAVVPHKTFHLEDGNVEVLCGNTLFRVHTSVLSFHSPTLRRMFAQTNLAASESPNGCPRILSSDAATDFATLLKMIYLPGFPEKNKVPDFATFSSLLRITTMYEMPAVRSQILEVVRDAYPETFEGLGPSKSLGESVFTGQTPHPNDVLNLFVQQSLTSALPMAYYMAAQRGPTSLMDRHLPRNATLSPEILQSAITGLIALREVELNETHRMIFEPIGSRPCSVPNCPSRTPTGPAALEAYRKVFGRIVCSSQLGTKVLQVPEFYEECGGDVQCVGTGICSDCVERWESGHAELRKKAWAMLPDVFGLKG